ncbi:MAG: glycosyl hydrolase, partial [Deltaproteobacteria bacterium]|nr:glycosyl hydrolase [Deltaproteobacteria bacterium]
METVSKAPAAQWHHPIWSTAQKSCVGTALGTSKLWFTTGSGIITEVFYPRIDIPQVRDLGFIIADDQGFWQELKTLPEPALELDDPQVPLPIIRHH